MTRIRVGIVSDFPEEGWHSMDLVADMLLECLPRVAGVRLRAERLCPPMVRRWSRLPLVGGGARARLGDRLTGRLWDYPRWLATRAAEFDVFHIVDHSYAHLVRVLPAARTIVTCHDIDAIRLALPDAQSRLHPGRLLAAGILGGLQRAAHVTCVSGATRNDLLGAGAVAPDRISVVHEGVHPSFVSSSSLLQDGGARERSASPELLHVGSTVPRKRIDVLLEVLAGVRCRVPGVRLVRVGGALTPEQEDHARTLGVLDAITTMPFLRRPELAALYRRASLVLLPSEREGFGLPLAEAMACGTPVVASAIPALREIGGAAAVYCEPGDVGAWIDAVESLLLERERDAARWAERCRRSMARAAAFTWDQHARGMAALYERLAAQAGTLDRSFAS